MSGACMLNPVDAAPALHWARISTPLNRVVACRVKSTGCPAFGTVKPAAPGPSVPNGNAGMFTVAFVALTSEKFCSPLPVSIGSTVTEPEPAVIDVNCAAPPARVSVIVKAGVHTPPGVGVGVGVGFGVGVGVGVTVGVGVGFGVGVGVAVGLGVGVGP